MKIQSTTLTSFREAHGALPYPLTNDFLFRILFQRNNHILCGLIRALLHIPPEIKITAEITNPILLGESVTSKELRLDINLILNHSTFINLEMQVANKFNWNERSLVYSCRAFEQLEHGDDYSELKPVIHIGFLDYTLFPEHPEFYATYKLMNVKNHNIYSSKLDLRVLDLTQIHLATEEDKRFHIDYWAQLFKSTTWEELYMLSEKDDYISDAVKTVFQVTTDAQLQKLIHDRREYINDMRYYNREIARLTKENEAHQKALSEKQQENEALKAKLSALEKQLNA